MPLTPLENEPEESQATNVDNVISKRDEETSDSSSSDDSDSDDSDDEVKEIPNLKFRSYKPFSPELQKKIVPGPSILEDLQWVDAELRAIVENCRKSEESLANIVPKQINWDLKRDLAPKMTILNAKTQRAIAELVRDKISQETTDK